MSRIRTIKLIQGDTLRGIALRELGDPTRWIEIADINALRPPYIVDSFQESDRLSNTLLWGDPIRIPALDGVVADTPTSIHGIDVELPSGKLTALNGDLATLDGTGNIKQALGHRVRIIKGELVHYPGYGCNIRLALGLKATPVIELMAAAWVHEAMRNESRLSRIDGVVAVLEGDILNTQARVVAAGTNTPVDLNLTFPANT